jgi:hypothetical protein
VTGVISRVPDHKRDVTFTCVVAVGGVCNVQVNYLNIKITAPDATHIAFAFQPATICAPGTTCTPVKSSDGTTTTDSQVATLGSCIYTTPTSTFNAFFPQSCYPCFGGATPLFTVSWQATSSAAC